MELLCISRLTLGWSWEQFVFYTSGSLVPLSNISRDWIVVVTRILLAILTFYIGSKAELYLHAAHKATKEHKNISAREAENESSEEHSEGGTMHDDGRNSNTSSNINELGRPLL